MMIGSFKRSITVLLIAFILGITGNLNVEGTQDKFLPTTVDDIFQVICQFSFVASFVQECHPTTTTANTPSAISRSPPSTSPSTPQSTTDIPTVLEHAHWCRFSNGTYIPLSYVFMYSPCTVCQCTASHEIRCALFSCMQSGCIDNSTASVRPHQCCAQCLYESPAKSCMYRGIPFPHGTIVQTTNNIKCWCQQGIIECRKSATSIFSGWDLWGSDTAVYAIVAILIICLSTGSLLVCGCTTLFYYYYQKQQKAVQRAHYEHWNNGGWLPIDEEGNVIEKQAEEVTQNQYEYDDVAGHPGEYAPPPCTVYKDSYVILEQVDGKQ